MEDESTSTSSQSTPEPRDKRRNDLIRLFRFTLAIVPFIGLLPGFVFILGVFQAAQLDKSVPVTIADTGRRCQEWADFTPAISNRVITENESAILTISVANRGLQICDIQAALINSSFEMSPQDNVQVVTLAPSDVGSVTWILTPKKTGTFEVGTSVGYQIRYLGITVTDAWGLTTRQFLLLSIVFAILGPAITVPFWLGIWKKRKERQQKEPGKVGGPRPPFE